MARFGSVHLLITRPLAQAEPWAEQLAALGISGQCIPVLELVALSSPEQVQAIKNRVLDFDLFQKAIFVSQNAVDFGMAWLEDYWPQLPLGIDYFAVGESTARSLRARGLAVSALGAAEQGAMNSESLLQAPEFQQVAGEKILIFRGLGGRGHMGDILRQRGAQVEYCELYQRCLPVEAPAALADFFARRLSQPNPLVLAIHSGDSLNFFMQALGKQPLIDRQRVFNLPLLVPGSRVAALAQAQGFRQIICAENATDKAMTQALVNYLSENESRD